jgi:hypothetical protein
MTRTLYYPKYTRPKKGLPGKVDPKKKDKSQINTEDLFENVEIFLEEKPKKFRKKP